MSHVKVKSQTLSATESFVCNCFKMEGESCALTPVKPLDKQTFISYISLGLQILPYFFFLLMLYSLTGSFDSFLGNSPEFALNLRANSL